MDVMDEQWNSGLDDFAWHASFDVTDAADGRRRTASNEEISVICAERGWEIAGFEFENGAPLNDGWAQVRSSEIDDAYDGGCEFVADGYWIDVP